MAVNDTIELQVQGTVLGQQHIHTLHFRYQEVTGTEQGLIDSWQATGRTAYRGCFSTNDSPVQLLRARQVCGSIPLRAPVEENEVTGSILGTINTTTEPLASWVSSVSSLRTASAGRSRRGRSFIGGLYEEMATGNNLTGTHVARIDAYLAALSAAYFVGGTNSTYKLVVYSRKLASVPGTQCQDSSTLITSMKCNSPIGSMKSRKPGSGS